MLLQVNNTANKKFLYKFLKKNNYFFVINVKSFQEIFHINDYFSGNILHSKQIINFFYENKILDIFSGNIYFCFVEALNFYDVFLDLYYSKLNKYNLDLVGVCYNNYFLNFNINYLNVLNCLSLNLFIFFFLILLFINLFFFKILVLLKSSLLLKKC
jgi:hypothetical protein